MAEMRVRIAAGVGLIIGGVLFQYLILFNIINDCAPRYGNAPPTRVCVPQLYIISITIVQICMVVGGGALILLGMWSRIAKTTPHNK
jgi:hypothetical protein